MAGPIYLIIPEATTNRVLNPSFETGVLNWTAAGSTLTQVSTWSKFGAYSMNAHTNNAGANEGAYASLTLAAGEGAVGQTWTASGWIYGPSGTARIRVYDATNANGTNGTTTTMTGTRHGHYLEVTHTISGGVCAALRVYVETNVQQHIDIRVDGVQCENKAYATTYIDGSRDGGVWTGTEHASTTTRSSQIRSGGKPVDLTTYGWSVGELDGIGMPPIQYNVQEAPLLPGGEVQSYKVKPRTITLTGMTDTDTWAAYLQARLDVVNALKPDLVTPLQPVRLQYRGGTAWLYMDAYYDSGLQGKYGKCGHEIFAVRLIAYDPFWYEYGDGAAIIPTSTTLAVSQQIAKFKGGNWDDLGNVGVAAGAIYAYAFAPNGDVYLGGAFQNMTAAAGDRILKYVRSTDTYSVLGSGTNGTVRCITIAPDGLPVIGGAFTTANAVTVNGVAKWTGTTFTCFGVGVPGGGVAGGTATVYDIAFLPDGNMVITGDFTSADGVAACDYIAKWTGATFAAYGTGLNGIGRRIRINPAGQEVVGGDFTTANGVTVNYLGRWTGATFTHYGILCDGFVRAMAMLPNGNFYIGGSFHVAPDGTAAQHIAKYSGAAFSSLGGSTNVNDVVNDISVGSGGRIHVTGLFFAPDGDNNIEWWGDWVEAAWRHLSMTMPTASQGYAIREAPNGDLYISFDDAAGNAYIYGALTTLTNYGTKTAYPIIVFKRTGGTSALLEAIRNETTGEEITLYRNLLDGETIIIDLRPGKKTVISSMFGNILGAVRPGSNLGSWGLLPGANSILTKVDLAGAPTITCYAYWLQPHYDVAGVL